LDIDVDLAPSGAEALIAFSNNKYDLVILDVELGDINGIEVCRKIRNSAPSEEVKIIVLTSHSEASVKELAMSNGADDYLNKPVDKDKFLKKIKLFLHAIGNSLKGRIMIIDDSDTSATLMKRMLLSLDFAVDTFKDYEEAKSSINNKSYDMFIVDIFLPGFNGIEVLKKIKEIEENKYVPVIGITGQKDIMLLKSFFLEGGADFLNKPLIIEEFVARINVHLKMSRVNKELKGKKFELSEILKFREKNFNFIVHELRTPISTIFTLAEMIKYNTQNEKDVLEYSNYILETASRLSDIVNSILEISKMESSEIPIHLKNINLHTIIKEIFSSMQVLANGKSIKLTDKTSEKSSDIKADREKLKTILENLISNSIKYSKKGEIEINLEKQSDFARIYIKDEGIGIPKGMESKIFEDYKRVSFDTKIMGTGIGLSLVKKLVEAHNGRVWVENNDPAQGCTFFVDIPQL
jgi:signal transduction histidine kinase